MAQSLVADGPSSYTEFANKCKKSLQTNGAVMAMEASPFQRYTTYVMAASIGLLTTIIIIP